MATNALYVSIYQEILLDIQNGKYVENEPLPSEESLCRSYNVSRTTVHKALDMLKDADVVYSVQGNGVYVKPHMFAQPLSKFYSFTDSLKSINILIQNEIIDCTLVRADILSHGSLYEFLRSRYGFHADRASETLRPVMPRPDERALLCISANTPCMLLERFSYEGVVLIEYTKSIVRGDKYTFQVEFQNPK